MRRTDRENYWRGHVGAACAHPVSMAAYCRETNIAYASLMYWKRRLALPQAGFMELGCLPDRNGGPALATVSVGVSGLEIVLGRDCPPEWAAGFVHSLASMEDER